MKNERKGIFGFLSMEMPHTYLLIFTILIICALLTYVVPAGQFETAANETGRQVLVPGTFHYVEQNPVTLYQFFNAIPTGLVSMASLIFFVMIADLHHVAVIDVIALDAESLGKSTRLLDVPLFAQQGTRAVHVVHFRDLAVRFGSRADAFIVFLNRFVHRTCFLIHASAEDEHCAHQADSAGDISHTDPSH